MKDVTKPCPKCSGVDYNKEKKCRLCINSKLRAKRSLNREAIRVQEKAYRSNNREKVAAKEKAWRDNNPDKNKNIRLRTMYGISKEDYDRMFEAQGGCCAICKKPETTVRKGKVIPLSVDHNHSCCPGNRSCGKCVRALLCLRHNNGLGCFNDDPSLLELAITYLKDRQQ